MCVRIADICWCEGCHLFECTSDTVLRPAAPPGLSLVTYLGGRCVQSVLSQAPLGTLCVEFHMLAPWLHKPVPWLHKPAQDQRL